MASVSCSDPVAGLYPYSIEIMLVEPVKILRGGEERLAWGTTWRSQNRLGAASWDRIEGSLMAHFRECARQVVETFNN